MLLMAVTGAITGYCLTQTLWRYHILRKRRARKRLRANHEAV
jgi:uncharacterized protein (DUF2062 family)